MKQGHVNSIGKPFPLNIKRKPGTIRSILCISNKQCCGRNRFANWFPPKRAVTVFSSTHFQTPCSFIEELKLRGAEYVHCFILCLILMSILSFCAKTTHPKLSMWDLHWLLFGRQDYFVALTSTGCSLGAKIISVRLECYSATKILHHPRRGHACPPFLELEFKFIVKHWLQFRMGLGKGFIFGTFCITIQGSGLGQQASPGSEASMVTQDRG